MNLNGLKIILEEIYIYFIKLKKMYLVFIVKIF